MSPDSRSERLVLLIPAWRPERRLVDLLRALETHTCLVPVIVFDGLVEDQIVAAELESMDGICRLYHAVNMGKGRALKTGFNWVLNEMPDAIGVVTADADGQHTPEDIVRVAEALLAYPRRFILGSRAFDHEVPLRSKLGNTLTRYVFWMLAGRRIGDTQSGLRALPIGCLPRLLTLDGERYEYEMNMLACLCRVGLPPQEVPIQTVYFESNRSSHFDPIRDSVRIYAMLIRFAMQRILSPRPERA